MYLGEGRTCVKEYTKRGFSLWPHGGITSIQNER